MEVDVLEQLYKQLGLQSTIAQQPVQDLQPVLDRRSSYESVEA